MSEQTSVSTSERDLLSAIEVAELTVADAPPMFELMQKNKSILEPVDIYVPLDVDDMLSKIKFASPESRQDLGIKLDGQLIGGIDLIPQGSKRAEVTYWIDSDHRGQGFAGEGLRQTIDLAFNNLWFDTLRAWVKQDNLASQRTLEKVGFQHVDTNSSTGSYGYTLLKPAAGKIT